LLALAVLAAVVIVLVQVRTLRGFLTVRLRYLWLLWAAAGAQFLRLSDPSWASAVQRSWRGMWPVLIIWLLAVAFSIANVRSLPVRSRTGLAVFVAGFSLNSLVIALNGGMPFSVRAAQLAGLPPEMIAFSRVGHRPLAPDSVLAPLADIVPVPGLQRVVSFGDLLILLGIAWLLVSVGLLGARHRGTDVRSAGTAAAVT
jgi:hypothetical protein